MSAIFNAINAMTPGGAISRSSTGLVVSEGDLQASDWVPVVSGVVPNGTALSLTGATPTLSLTFPKVPSWFLGKGPWPPPGNSFQDPNFSLNAGLLHQQSDGNGGSWSNLAHELEVYPNGAPLSNPSLNPFSISSDGALCITASPLPAGTVTPSTLAAPNPVYLSGAFNSWPYGQIHGIFSANMKLPGTQAVWPAFWLLPVNEQVTTECDVIELLGQQPTVMNSTLHSHLWSTQTVPFVAPEDLTEGYHEYTVDIGPAVTTFYLDMVSIASFPTPPDYHVRFYLNFNLAIGGAGSWPGAPSAATAIPAQMFIKSVRVWQRGAY